MIKTFMLELRLTSLWEVKEESGLRAKPYLKRVLINLSKLILLLFISLSINIHTVFLCVGQQTLVFVKLHQMKNLNSTKQNKSYLKGHTGPWLWSAFAIKGRQVSFLWGSAEL